MESEILKCSKNLFFKNFFLHFLIGFFFMYIKMPKNLSAKYDQIKKEYKKMLLKNTKIFLKKKKKKTNNGRVRYKNI